MAVAAGQSAVLADDKPGDEPTVSYAVNVTNHGPSDAQSVVLSDALPAWTTLVSETPSAGLTVSGDQLTYAVPTLAAGLSETFTVVGLVAGDTPDGTVVADAATVGAFTADPDPANNGASAPATVYSWAPAGAWAADPQQY